jgi:hypothetical protein
VYVLPVDNDECHGTSILSLEGNGLEGASTWRGEEKKAAAKTQKKK